MDNNLYQTGDGSVLRFWDEPQRNNAASERVGRPIFDTCLMVEVITPGSKESSPIFELERIFADEVEIDKPRRSPRYEQYGAQITAYRGGDKPPEMSGTPISDWPSIGVAMAATLKELHIFTVEALAALPDEKLRVIGPGALALRDRAKAFLAAAAGNAPFEALATENAKLKEHLAELQATVNAMQLNAKPAAAAKPARGQAII